MNTTAKSNFSPHRLPVQWLDMPAVGPLLICQRKLSPNRNPNRNPNPAVSPFLNCRSNALPIDGPGGRAAQNHGILTTFYVAQISLHSIPDAPSPSLN